jgi:hypothetical protein
VQEAVAAAVAATRGEHVRARQMKIFLECVEAQEPSARDVLLSALPAADLALVREAGPLAWLPAEVNARATEIVWSGLGPRAREAFFLRLGAALFESTLLNALLAGAVRLFGVAPGKILRWTPRAWPQIYRDGTRVTVTDVDAHALRIRFDSIPRCLATCPGWMESAACCVTAMFDVVGRTGAAAVEERDPANGRMVLRVRWQRVA